MNRHEELVRNLRIKAHMIYMGERIEFGSEVALMEEAADLIESLTENTAKRWLREVAEAAKKAGQLGIKNDT
jgi:hypothetical protein